MHASLARKKWSNFAKNCFLKLSFQDEDQLYADCLFHILTIYRKSFLFQFLLRDVCMTRFKN